MPHDPKPTLVSTHPHFVSSLINIILREFRTVRKFSELADIENTRLYAFLREDERGAIPRLHTVTKLMRAVRKHAPDRFDELMEAYRRDIEAGLDNGTKGQAAASEAFKGITEQQLDLVFRKHGWTLPRPSVAKRFRILD